jgi:hypothetical protein
LKPRWRKKKTTSIFKICSRFFFLPDILLIITNDKKTKTIPEKKKRKNEQWYICITIKHTCIWWIELTTNNLFCFCQKEFFLSWFYSIHRKLTMRKKEKWYLMEHTRKRNDFAWIKTIWNKPGKYEWSVRIQTFVYHFSKVVWRT